MSLRSRGYGQFQGIGLERRRNLLIIKTMTPTVSMLMIAAATLAVLSLKRVPEGQAYTIHRFGHYRRTLDAGLHWILPLIEKLKKS